MSNALDDYEAKRYASGEYQSLYRGLPGLLMKASHRMMERGVSPASNARVLEIGGGGMPHFYWMNSAQMRSYTVSDRLNLHHAALNELQAKLPSTVMLSLHDFDSDPTLATLDTNYTRVVASHVLEHIPDPEQAIVSWAKRLTPDGMLSIAIPCDPGWGWRLGQLVAYRSYKIDISFRDYDLLMSREHVNSVQRILKIARYYFRNVGCRWLPAVVPVVDLNLVCSITLNMRDWQG